VALDVNQAYLVGDTAVSVHDDAINDERTYLLHNQGPGTAYIVPASDSGKDFGIPIAAGTDRTLRTTETFYLVGDPNDPDETLYGDVTGKARVVILIY